ncbi:ABC transporter substrate-binding protein [Pantoea cypripedii]|uniref:Sugar ABC transporter substrate-binding protein n=1 Tax=Pantoea cypripedii TaxID=55209 RepID=A0A6B9G8R3_PANCY|nr:ABC transporter substrate-binding protein [Pantoea cypripedii]QGY32912.1 sugar ABC transporter substrate-binding protein [Pantoea cypripedii]
MSFLIASTIVISGFTILNAAKAETDKPVIGLSNSYYGNTWRRQMVNSFEEEAKKAKEQGLIADYVVFNSDGTAAQQSSQVAQLILKGVNAIAIDAASETALNGVIEKACKAGIKVVSFDSVASAKCNTQLPFDFAGYKREQTEATLKQINYKGNVIIVRGVKGNVPDMLISSAQNEILKKYPDVKVVATVYGQATASVAQSAVTNVLPSLPHVDAVLAQGGSDDIGIAQAFEQFGGSYKTKMPVIEGGGSSNFIHWWAKQREANGYSTTSMNVTPGVGGAAFWLAYEMAIGTKVPAKMIMPVVTVTNDTLSQFTHLPDGVIVSPSYDLTWVKSNLLQPK